MIAQLMTVLGFSDTGENNDSSDLSRRMFPRRAADKCIGLVNGQALPILDWSPGGVRVLGENRTYNLGEHIDVMLKFHLNDQLIDVKHSGKVVRKSTDFFAVQFEPLTSEIKNTFQHVIDSFNAEEFVASQA
jgi:hypothetical protein